MNTHSSFFKALLRLSCALALLVGIMAVPQEKARATITTFTVNTYADLQDNFHGDGVCNASGNVCTLRAAIEEASDLSTVSNPVTIQFGISGMPDLIHGTLYLEGDYITIDGGTHNIVLSGAGLPAGASVFQISGSHNLLENLSINGSKGDGIQIGDFLDTGEGNYNDLNNLYIYGSAWSGIYVHGSLTGGNNNRVFNSHIGMSTTSNLCAAGINNGYDGIFINGGADGTQLLNDTIVCNLHNGVFIAASGSSDTVISSCHIGTTGNNYVIGNGWSGIQDSQNTNTQITNNIISGNSLLGIYLDGSIGAKVYGNKIGTNEAGDHAMANLQNGIEIINSASGTLVGSPTDVNKRNIISGNGWSGVSFASGAHNNVLDGNYIGLGANGSTIIPNGYAGVAIEYADSNDISSIGDSPLPQFISGNTREGVYVLHSMDTDINKRTFIGVASDMSTAGGNGLEGVKLDTGTTYTEIYSQKIVYNGGAGIAVVGNSTTGNYLMPWFVGRNSGIPIDLGNDGFTENGTRTLPGPNSWQSYPLLTGMTADGFSGQTCPTCRVYVYRAVNDPTGPQGGGGSPVELVPDSFGNFSYSIPTSAAAVTMEACDMSTFNCSEMSPKINNPAWHYVYLPLVNR